MGKKWNKVLALPFHRPRQESDETLVDRARQGDQEAWGLFLERYTDLIYARALAYSRTAPAFSGAADREDEAGELYLFMAGQLQKSLQSFRGDCRPATWVHAVIGRRRAVLKAYLRQKDPHRADVRLPRALQGALADGDEEVFRRLVWGLEPEDIAIELDVAPSRCREVEDLVSERSPRVHARILENRGRRTPHLSLDLDQGPEDDGRAPLHLAHSDPDPDQALEQRQRSHIVSAGLERALAGLSVPERRVLNLLYTQGATVAEIVSLAQRDDSLGLGEIEDPNQVYYLRDKAMKAILAGIGEEAEADGDDAGAARAPGRGGLQALEQYLLEHGLPGTEA